MAENAAIEFLTCCQNFCQLLSITLPCNNATIGEVIKILFLLLGHSVRAAHTRSKYVISFSVWNGMITT